MDILWNNYLQSRFSTCYDFINYLQRGFIRFEKWKKSAFPLYDSFIEIEKHIWKAWNNWQFEVAMVVIDSPLGIPNPVLPSQFGDTFEQSLNDLQILSRKCTKIQNDKNPTQHVLISD